jgi:hypothetical protein
VRERALGSRIQVTRAVMGKDEKCGVWRSGESGDYDGRGEREKVNGSSHTEAHS